MIEVEGLTRYTRDRPAVLDVSFTVRRAEALDREMRVEPYPRYLCELRGVTPRLGRARIDAALGNGQRLEELSTRRPGPGEAG